MRLEYRIPSAQLRSSVTVHALCSDVSVMTTEVLPAMLPNLHIRLSGCSTYLLKDGRACPSPRVALIGPTSEAYRIVLEPGLVLLTVGLLPAGWQALLGMPAAEVGDMVLDGEAVWGHEAIDRLCDRLCQASLDTERIALAEGFLMERMAMTRARQMPALAAIDHWVEHDRALSLDALAEVLGVGHRQMRRLTLDLHGVPPKTLAMKYRSLRAAAGMAQQGTRALQQALASYADQAHLTRDFRRFVGWTPVAFARERQNIAAATFSGRLRAGAIRPLSLLS